MTYTHVKMRSDWCYGTSGPKKGDIVKILSDYEQDGFWVVEHNARDYTVYIEEATYYNKDKEMTKLSPNQQLALAIQLAAQGHIQQVDKGGKPYILHPLKVMHYLKTEDMELMAIAVMHDLQEDSDLTLEDLRDKGFSDRVIEGVRLMSKEKGMTYEQYIDRMIPNIDAVRVKLADLRHNTDVRRLKGLEEKDFERMKKYHQAYLRLKAVLDSQTKP